MNNSQIKFYFNANKVEEKGEKNHLNLKLKF